MHAQDLHAAEAPTEPLALQGGEGQRHDALAVGLRDVDPRVPVHQQAERGLGVLGDAPFVPAPELLQQVAPKKSHRAGEDDRVALVARGHRRGEEVLVRVVTGFQVGVAVVVPIVLRALDECDVLVGEVSNQRVQVGRVDQVVGIDRADQFGARVRVFAQDQVQGARLVPGDSIHVNEGDAFATLAILLDRSACREARCRPRPAGKRKVDGSGPDRGWGVASGRGR